MTIVTLPAFLGLPGYQVCKVPGEQWTLDACGLPGGPKRDAFAFCHGEGAPERLLRGGGEEAEGSTRPEPVNAGAGARVWLRPHVLRLSVLAYKVGVQSGKHTIGVGGPHRHCRGCRDEV